MSLRYGIALDITMREAADNSTPSPHSKPVQTRNQASCLAIGCTLGRYILIPTSRAIPLSNVRDMPLPP